VKFRTQVVPILSNHCAQCHTTGGPGASSVLMFTRNSAGALVASYTNISTNIDEMITAIETRRMPKDRVTANNEVGSSELTTLKTWRDDGAPNN
jgi:hypothetical protein